MCTDCGGICDTFTDLVAQDSFFRPRLRPVDAPEKWRHIHPTNVGTETDQTDTVSLGDLVAQAGCIGMTPEELEDELAARSGFVEHVRNWVTGMATPNGLARKIILTCAEQVIREHGANPVVSLLPA